MRWLLIQLAVVLAIGTAGDVVLGRFVFGGSVPQRSPVTVRPARHSPNHQTTKHHLTTACAPSPQQQPLIIWTSRWCGVCRRFWSEYSSDPAFRRALSRYRIHVIDVTLRPREATSHSVTTLPTFDLPHQRIVGYAGKEWLLSALHRDALAPSAPLSPLDRAPRERVDTHPDAASSAPDEQPPSRTDFQSVRNDDAPLRDDETQTGGMIGNPSYGSNRSPHTPLLLRIIEVFRSAAPVVLTGLELTGIVGGTAATGGLGALALSLAWRTLRRRIRRRRRSGIEGNDASRSPAEGECGVMPRAPFPRRLDEARQLLQLRQSEGRVAVLDALRGMFLDDEIDKLTGSADEQSAAIADRLKTAIDARVDEVAPLSTKAEDGG